MSLKRQFSQFFELPEEIIMDAPLVMLVDRHKLYLENHKGIALYQENEIKIRLNSGFFLIFGSDLKIGGIEAEIIEVTGKIRSFEFREKDGEKS
ncbi:MAG: YabP/YqfC family sporulation protein [Halanaerobiaceae bacterium]